MADKVSAGDVKQARVTIELGDDEITLIPSPDAILTLSAKYDGFSPLIAALQRLNVQASVDTVIAGVGAEGKAAKAIAGQVVEHGIVALMPKLVEFVMILANGGKPLRDAPDQEGNTDPSR